MKLNKMFLPCMAIAAIGLTSCSDEDGPTMNLSDDKAISFSTYTGKNTPRASILDNNALKSSGFGVFGFHTGLNEYNPLGSTLNMMNNQNVFFNTGAQTWEYSPVKYWAENLAEKYTFLAYAPYSNLGTSDILTLASNGSGDPVITYKLPSVIEDQIDFVYSNSNVNVMKPDNGQIPFNFKHALCRIGFAAVTDLDPAKTQVTIDKITLSTDPGHALQTKANFNLRTGVWEEINGGAGNFNFVFTPDNFVSPIVTQEMKQLTNDNSYLMVIPGSESRAKGISASIEYTIRTYDSALPNGYHEQRSTRHFNSHHGYLKGTSHIFVINITAAAVSLEAKVENWDEKEINEIR